MNQPLTNFQDLRKKVTRDRWTSQGEDELKTLWAMHQDDVLISKKMGRTEASIASRGHLLRLVKFNKKSGKKLDVRRPQAGGGHERIWY